MSRIRYILPTNTYSNQEQRTGQEADKGRGEDVCLEEGEGRDKARCHVNRCNKNKIEKAINVFNN